jgi:drug/metabolite transporter (DMT)-like permease
MNPPSLQRANMAGILWMTLSMAAFAVEDVFIKTLTRQLPLGQVLMLFGVGGAIVFAWLARRKNVVLLTKEVLTPLMLLRAVSELLGRLFYVLLGAKIFFKERIDWRVWLAIWIGLLGVLVIVRPSAQDFSFLSLLAVIGTVGFVGRDLATRATAMTVTMEALGFYGFSTMLLAGASFAVWDAQAFVMLTQDQLVNLVVALAASVLAYIALVTAMRTGTLAAVTPFRYTRLLFGVSLGVFVFGERPDLPMLLGCAIVIGAGLYIGWQGKARQAA